MKKIVLAILLCAAFTSINAQQIRVIWINTPDTLTPYLSRSLRTELADYVNMDMPATVKNRLADSTKIALLTDRFIAVELNKTTHLQIKQVNDTTIAVVKTFHTPQAESTLKIYNTQWQLKHNIELPKPEWNKAESVTEEKLEELKQWAKFYLTQIEISPNKPFITLSYNFPLMPSDLKQDLKKVIKQTIMEWNGKTYEKK